MNSININMNNLAYIKDSHVLEESILSELSKQVFQISIFNFLTSTLPRDGFTRHFIWQSILAITLDKPINVRIVFFVLVKKEME